MFYKPFKIWNPKRYLISTGLSIYDVHKKLTVFGWLMNKTIDGVSKDSSQMFCLALNTTLYNIIIFIYYLICNLALTRLYICIELYHPNLNKAHININILSLLTTQKFTTVLPISDIQQIFACR